VWETARRPRSGGARALQPGARSVPAGCRRPQRAHRLLPAAGARPRRPVPGGWPPGGLLAGGLVAGLGMGDGGHTGQVHGHQRDRDDACAGAFGHGRSPVRQLALCGRPAGWSAATPGHRVHCHQRRASRDRRRRGGRAPPISRAWLAWSCRSVMRCSARAWLSPACWLCMDFIPSRSSAAWIVAGSGWAGGVASESGRCHMLGAGLFPIFGR
jgi:hypothetical protein